ncbi:MAG TPA: hypothetical protein VK666_13190 [Chryseolinea sp.]|nr:hypothetical protein [Chryseolinea sp.]
MLHLAAKIGKKSADDVEEVMDKEAKEAMEHILHTDSVGAEDS